MGLAKPGPGISSLPPRRRDRSRLTAPAVPASAGVRHPVEAHPEESRAAVHAPGAVVWACNRAAVADNDATTPCAGRGRGLLRANNRQTGHRYPETVAVPLRSAFRPRQTAGGSRTDEIAHCRTAAGWQARARCDLAARWIPAGEEGETSASRQPRARGAAERRDRSGGCRERWPWHPCPARAGAGGVVWPPSACV